MTGVVPTSAPGWWALIGLALLILELLIPGVFLLWIGLAALGVAALLMAVDLSFAWQTAAFIVFALGAVVIGSRLYRRLRPDSQGALRAPENSMVGRGGEVVEPLRHGRGKVKVGDSVWLAEGPDLAAGAAVRVVGQRGTALIVAPDEN